MSNLIKGVAFETIVQHAKPTKSARGVWRKPKYSGRRIAQFRKAAWAEDKLHLWDEKVIRKAMGRTEVKTIHFKTPKGHKSQRNRLARLEMMEKKLKEIPKIVKQYKAQLVRDKLRGSKEYKGFNLMFTPKITPFQRATNSRIELEQQQEIPKLDKKLKGIAENKHLLKLPPHLQAEKDELVAKREAGMKALKAAREAAAAAKKQSK